MIRIRNTTTPLPPSTAEERARALEALDRLRRRRERLPAERGGEFFPSAADVIRELREAPAQDVP